MPNTYKMDTSGALRRRATLIVLTIASIASMATPSGGAESLSDKQASVTQTQARIDELSKKMTSLLAEAQALDSALTSTSASLAVKHLMLTQKLAKAGEARTVLNARAAEAYKRGVWRQAHLLLGLKSYSQILSFGEYVGGAMSLDQEAYLKYTQAADALKNVRATIDSDKQRLAEAEKRMMSIRDEISSALLQQQKILTDKKAEVAALEAQRRRTTTGTVSPVVAQRRATRQVELDKKLAALLAWYAPGYGPEPFMPSMLKPTGIVSTGYATWYGPGFDGRRAASGATYNQEQLTAASLVLPFGTLLKVTYNNKSVVVVITDRGPYVANRVLDLSHGASVAIGHSGVKMVRMEILTPSGAGAPSFP